MEHALPLPHDGDPRPDHDAERRIWLRAAGTAGGVAAVAAAVPFVSTLAPSERAKALGAAIEVDIADLPLGVLRTVEWRGKPVWILRRTPDMLEALAAANPELSDPASDKPQQPGYARNATRSIQPEVLVAVGLCTHLGCSPTWVAAGQGHPSLPGDWPGGFFCPCHGSIFDAAGRVYRNKPAPANLEIPPHRYVGATRLLIGDDKAA
jgi:ubiquinol-cytochrome c reductase iron-sulfur subunit